MIYIVTQGSYSDYSIRAVFTTKEGAEAWVAGLNERQKEQGCGDDATIEEYEADVPIERSGAFYAWVDEDGLGGGAIWSLGMDPDEPALESTAVRRDGKRSFRGHGRTAEHAMRSARELARAVKAGTVVTSQNDRANK